MNAVRTRGCAERLAKLSSAVMSFASAHSVGVGFTRFGTGISAVGSELDAMLEANRLKLDSQEDRLSLAARYDLNQCN